ncbi:MAG: hypothetical protein ACYDHY_16065 [Acidiferrobacterales bacterium]
MFLVTLLLIWAAATVIRTLRRRARQRKATLAAALAAAQESATAQSLAQTSAENPVTESAPIVAAPAETHPEPATRPLMRRQRAIAEAQRAREQVERATERLQLAKEKAAAAETALRRTSKKRGTRKPVETLATDVVDYSIAMQDESMPAQLIAVESMASASSVEPEIILPDLPGLEDAPPMEQALV